MTSFSRSWPKFEHGTTVFRLTPGGDVLIQGAKNSSTTVPREDLMGFVREVLIKEELEVLKKAFKDLGIASMAEWPESVASQLFKVTPVKEDS